MLGHKQQSSIGTAPPGRLGRRSRLAAWWQVSGMLLLLLVFFCARSSAAGRYLTEEEALRLAFPGAQFKEELAIATNAQRKEIGGALNKDASRVSRFFRYHRATRSDRLQGYAVIGEVIGKHKPITYMLAFTPAHEVKAMEILVYREAYGHEIRQPNFREQFYGKAVDDPLRLNHDIQNISGATISCRSMIQAVRENLAILNVLVPRHPVRAERQESKSDLDTGSVRSGAAEEETVMRRRMRVLMGTTLEVTAYGPNLPAVDRAVNAAFDEVDRIEGLLSTYRPGTVISELNAHGHERQVQLGAETWNLLQRSQAFTRMNGGWFDISVGPLVELWQKAQGQGRPPTEPELAAARSAVGAGVLQLLPDQRAQLAKAGARLDLGAIGKGYALDRAAEVLRANGVGQAMLNFGGHILALDPPRDQPGWQVFVQDPQTGALLAHVQLANESLATSADSERSLRIEGRSYSHVVNPHTGHPVIGALSASVITPHAERTDAWATSLFASGAEEAVQTARERGLAALVVDREGRVIQEGTRFDLLEKASQFSGIRQ